MPRALSRILRGQDWKYDLTPTLSEEIRKSILVWVIFKKKFYSQKILQAVCFALDPVALKFENAQKTA